MLAFCFQPGHQLPRRHSLPQHKHPVCEILPVFCLHNPQSVRLGDFHRFFPDDFHALRQSRFFLIHRKIYHPGADFVQKNRFLLFRRAVCDHGCRLSPIQWCVAGGAVAHTPAQQFLFARQRFCLHDPGRKDYGLRFDHLFPGLQGEVVSHGINRADALLRDFNPHPVQLVAESRCHVRSANKRQTRIVPDFMRFCNLRTHLPAAQKYNPFIPIAGRQCSRNPAGACSDDRDLNPLHRPHLLFFHHQFRQYYFIKYFFLVNTFRKIIFVYKILRYVPAKTPSRSQ